MGSWKGISLEQGTVVILELCGTLVYVEAVAQTYVALVALPEQPPEAQTSDRVFTPGRVGAKKIAPFAQAAKVIPIADLSDRNKGFIGTYEQLRAAHGVNHVDRTPEELAAQQAAVQPAPKADKVDKAARRAEQQAARAQRKADRLAAKGAKLGVTVPRYQQRCVACGEQPGHPDHGKEYEGQHPFIAPPEAEVAAPTPKAPKPSRAAKPTKGLPAGPYAFTGTDASLTTLAAVNPKYKEGNSGAEIVRTIRENGDTGVDLAGILADLASHPRWSTVPQERIEFALGQLLAAGLIKVVVP